MKNFFIGLLLTIILSALIGYAFSVASDRICSKQFSAEFKKTQQYKDMQCK